MCLGLAGEAVATQALDTWLDLFSSHYLAAKRGLPPPQVASPQASAAFAREGHSCATSMPASITAQPR